MGEVRKALATADMVRPKLPSGSMIDFESQSALTLLALAEERPEIDTTSCARVFSYLRRADRVRNDLRDALTAYRLSNLQFAILLLLYSVDPESVPMAVIARKAGVSRSATTSAFDSLVGSGLASRDRYGHDRRVIGGRISTAGKQKTQQAISDYLRAAVGAASKLVTERA